MATTGEKSVDALEGAVGGKTTAHNETALLKAECCDTAPSTELSESDRALHLSSINTNPLVKIFQWLNSVNWAIEYHADDMNDARVVFIGISGIIESEARQCITDAGFSDCGVEFSIFQSRLAGAVFTRCVRPGSMVFCGVGAPVNQALLAGVIGGSGNGSGDRRFALSVAHLFRQVDDECTSRDGQVLGYCKVWELDEVQVASGVAVFADVSIIQLRDSVVADNTVEIIDSYGRQRTCRTLRLIEPEANAGVRVLRRDGTWQQGIISNPGKTIKLFENGQVKTLQNIVCIHRDDMAISDRGDSGTLICSTRDPTDEGLSVYGMAVGKADLTDHTSFTIANRLCDILPAIRNDPNNFELFRGYKELNFSGIAAEPDSGFRSSSA